MIRGFQITHKIHETGHSVIFRAIRTADDSRVVLKLLSGRHASPRALARYRQEYEIISALRVPGVTRAYSLEKVGNTVGLVLEDIDGSSLNLAFQDQRPTIEQLLELAIQITTALDQIHQHGIVHKDINPSNIVWNPRTHQLKLIDFGIATRLPSELPAFQDPCLLEGTLPYLSPEQTGRMNRRLDYRTDFYSLGVTLYELLTGRLPFDRSDALGLVHCHLAVQPRPPTELREDVPPILSRLVMKLLAKTAEDRYRSASGLALDLERCRELLRSGKTALIFPLARADSDASDRFTIPQKLYGRGRETTVLVDALERSAQGQRELVLVTGHAGIGKSALVRELYKPITRKNAFFAHGKPDFLQRATPYGALSAACAGLVAQLVELSVRRSKQELLHWRHALQEALGSNGRLLIDLIPELELVIGAQPPVEELGPAEAHDRMRLAFCSFLRVFCRPAQPLVLFLDDLQWADPATLALLASLEATMSAAGISHFLLVGAYRDNEVDSAHPLAAVLRSLEDRGLVSGRIQLSSLGIDDMAQLLADALYHPPAAVRPLAELVLRRTGGNPLFTGELLKTLHADGLLRFERALLTWRWDMAAIEAAPIADNVVELLRSHLRKLPEDTQALLRLAACIGSSFDLDTMARIADRSLAETAQALMAAIQAGYIDPASEPELVTAERQEPQLLLREHGFAHDCVQQAAHALIPAEQRAAMHLHIGHRLLTRLGPEQRDARLFELVEHLNRGRSQSSMRSGELPVTAIELARLNQTAGQRARAAAAHGAAAHYLGIAIELAGDAWEEHHDLVLSLHVELAMAEYGRGELERSQALIETALHKATSAVIKARLYQISIIQHANQARYEDAIEAAREALHLLGQTLPRAHELADALRRELAEIRQILGERSIESLGESLAESLADAPEMDDDLNEAAIEVLAALAPTAYQADAQLHSFLAARMVKLMLVHGPTATGVVGYALYGLMLGTRFGDYQRGYHFGALALRLAERFHDRAGAAHVGFSMLGSLGPWTRPLKDAQTISLESFEAALQQGELQYASFSLMQRQVHSFYQGESLGHILDESASYMQLGQNTRQTRGQSNEITAVTCTLEAFRIVAAHLSQATGYDDIVDMDADADFIARCQQESSYLALGLYQVAKCQALYLYQDYHRALHAAREAEKLRDYMPGMIAVAMLELYHALCTIALFPHDTPEQQPEVWHALEARHAQLRRWMDNNPHSFRHMYLLVSAELARLQGDHLGAMEHYAHAIDAAEDSDFRQHVALANELAARFFLARKKTRYAMFHLRDALHSYEVWGAKRKLAMLEEQHGALLIHAGPGPWNDALHRGEPRRTTRRTAPAVSTAEQLDLATVIEASQALSSEISLDRLLARLIEIVIESAGAQHGCLILERRDRFAIEARGTLGERNIEVLTSLPLEAVDEGRPLVSAAIVHYVLRSRETIVLHDAVQEGAFVTDPYVLATKPRSILCMPLLNQGNVRGAVYLENNLSPHAFTPARVELLGLLSAQMAISLENSNLYSNLHRASQDMERLLYSIAHDLKEPLRAVQSFSELLIRRYGTGVDDKGRDYLVRIVKAAEHLGNLLDAIRTISEIRRTDGPRQQVAGESLVQEALKKLRQAIEQTRATVRTSGAFPQLSVDRRWAAEAIRQILHNALQYTRGGLAPEVDIEPYAGSEGLGFVIKDRGPGIAVEYAEPVFELFRRAVGRDIPGTGAGLAIVRQIAAKHGGNAWLTPRSGGGTEVYITLGR